MWIIDRYLLRQYAFTFVICFVSLAGLYTVIDAFGRLDDFTAPGRTLADSVATAAQYYALQSVGFFNKTSGVLALIAAMFTVTWAQRNNEMTALLAAGLPRLRVLRPVLISAVAIAILSVGLREFVIPKYRNQLITDSKHAGGEALAELAPRYDNFSDILIGGAQVAPERNTILEPRFDLPPGYADRFNESLAAAEAIHYAKSGERPAGYLLRGVTRPADIDSRPSLFTQEGEPLIVTRSGADWLKPGEAYVVSGVPLGLLISGSQWRDLAPTTELVSELSNPSIELGADARVAAHTRLVQPLLDVTLLMIGLPLVVSRGASSPYLAVGLGIAVVACFFIISLGGQALGIGGWLSPTLAAWAPLFLFVPFAAGQSTALDQ